MPARGIIPAMSLDSASSQQSAPAYRPTATVQAIGSRWAVAAGHPLAAEAAAHVLGAGGNARDAGVAAGLTLGVVHPDMVSVAGVAPILVHLARTGETRQVSGVAPYPRASTPEYFRGLGNQIAPALARAEKSAGGSRAAGIRAARDEFYRGETAKRIAEFHRAEKGPLTLDDLAAFEVEIERALVGTWGPWQVGVCGFWCQGPVLLQMLNLLEGTDLAALGHNSPAYLHLIAETVKVAFAEREAYYGDPNVVDVPAEMLLSK